MTPTGNPKLSGQLRHRALQPGWPRSVTERTRFGLARSGRRAFTLIEVLLATILLLLLLGAVVFNFSSLEQGAKLDEGASQFESLIRYARAHAASSGRLVRLSFEEEIEPGISVPMGMVRVSWEPDPLGQPGVFEDLALVQNFVERINDLVEVDSVELGGPGGAEAGMGADFDALDDATGSERAWFVPPISFYPDGSSDTAEIVLISNDEADRRRVSLRLVGVTGAIRRTTIEATEEGADESEAADKSGVGGGAERAGMVDRATTSSQPAPAGSAGRSTESP